MFFFVLRIRGRCEYLRWPGRSLQALSRSIELSIRGVVSRSFRRTLRGSLKGADCAVIMNEWDEFGKIKAKDYRAYMKTPNILDARRIYDAKDFKETNYVAIGLGLTSSE